MEPFKKGDCKDACIGTLLKLCLIDDPGIFIFKDIRFTLAKVVAEKRPLELSYRVGEYIDEITQHTGIIFQFHSHATFRLLLQNILAHLKMGNPIIVVVDHYHYEPSQFYQSLHMPHYIILTGYHKGEFTYLDPFPFYDVSGALAEDTLQQLMDSLPLEADRNVYLTMDSHHQKELNAEKYILSNWRDTLSSNIEMMLNYQGVNDTLYGIDAIHQMAVYMEKWNNNDEFFAQYRAVSNKFPINSFLDVGGNRKGHADYLAKLSPLLEEPAFLDIAEQFRNIASYWNTISSLRHLYQEENISSQYKISNDFMIRKLKKVPLLIHEIAEKEQAAFLRLKKFL